MDVIEKEKLQDNALDVGNYWTSKIRNLKSQFPIIGDVRYDVINRYVTVFTCFSTLTIHLDETR